jgi:hypothetical protein
MVVMSSEEMSGMVRLMLEMEVDGSMGWLERLKVVNGVMKLNKRKEVKTRSLRHDEFLENGFLELVVTVRLVDSTVYLKWGL